MKRRNTEKKILLSLTLGLAMTCVIPTMASAANSGGVADKPKPGDYTGTVDGTNPTAENGNLTFDTDLTLRKGAMIFGGYSDTAGVTVKNNSVTINGGRLIFGDSSEVDNYGDIFGGRGKNDVIGNHVTINGGIIGVGSKGYLGIYGGIAENGVAANNSVTINNVTLTNVFIWGGSSNFGNVGNVTNNSVTVNGGSIQGEIIGGEASNQSAGNTMVANNSVTVNNATVEGSIYGAVSIMGAVDVVNNSVIVDNSTVTGDIYGGGSANNPSAGNMVANNSVIVDNSTVTGDIYGGYSANNPSAGNMVANNSVTVNNATVKGSILGAMSIMDAGGAVNNSVIVDNSTVTGDICGGYSAKSFATGNVVTVYGGTFTGDICGGRSAESFATGNVVTVYGGTFTGDIYGGYSRDLSKDVFTGNTLHWRTAASVKGVHNFEYYNFTIPATAVPGDTLINVVGADKTDMVNAKVKLVGVEGTRKWRKGESVTLLKNPNGIKGDPTLIQGKMTEGIKLYEYALALGTDNITATITKAGLGDQAKSLSEGRMAGLGFLNGAADLVAGDGMTSAARSASDGAYDIFGAINYTGNKLKSGSHVAIKGTSLLVGASRNLQMNGGDWMIGAFVEGGKGKYDTYNTFKDAGEIHADGNSNYWGVGVMAKRTNKSNVYVEGSLKVGRVSNDYNSRDLKTNYDSRSTYYGAHVGVGTIIKLSEKSNLDVYGKYFWSKQNGATVEIKGDDFNFDSLNSNRVRVGARMNIAGSKGITTYVGMAYEHEFSANASANYDGESVAEPSLKGGTGIAEIGLTYRPQETKNFSMNLGLVGYSGKREGLGGGFKFNWDF